jgi:hypothetical protein
MTNKGKHATQTPATFYRDLAIMVLGILVVGAAVFLILYLLADEPATGPTTTTTTIATTTTTSATTSTTADGSTTTTVSPSTTLELRQPAEIAVVVLNSIGIDGAAGRLTADLAAEGYQTLTPDNYQPEVDPSRIWFREGFAAEASRIVDLIPGATVEPLPDDSVAVGADIVIVLGTGYGE